MRARMSGPSGGPTTSSVDDARPSSDDDDAVPPAPPPAAGASEAPPGASAAAPRGASEEDPPPPPPASASDEAVVRSSSGRTEEEAEAEAGGGGGAALRIKPEYLLSERSLVLAAAPPPPPSLPPSKDDDARSNGGDDDGGAVQTDGGREDGSKNRGGGGGGGGGGGKRNNRRRKKRGQNRKRPRDAPVDFSQKICRSILTGEVCPWGPAKCRYAHDVKELLADRPPDIKEVEGGCPSYNLTGRCEYGVTCRVGSKHLNLSTGANLTRDVDDDGNPIVPPEPTRNVLKKDVQTMLRKNRYPFVCGRRVPREKGKDNGGKKKGGGERRRDDGKGDKNEEGVDGNDAGKKGGDGVDGGAERARGASRAEAGGAERARGASRAEAGGASGAASEPEEEEEEEGPKASTEDLEGGSSADGARGGTTAATEAVSADGGGGGGGEEEAERPTTAAAAGSEPPSSSSAERGSAAAGVDGSESGDAVVAAGTKSDGETAATATTTKPEGDGGAVRAGPEPPAAPADPSPCPPPEPRKIVDFRNKVYVAPLTTVGNLPFRRIVKRYGADVTCGEMALASNLLEGKPSEWALLKRHPSEDVFGVQIASGFVDQFTRVSELIENEVECDFVDLNLGCPIDLICDRGAGAALMLRERRLKDCLIPIAKNLSRPVTVKMRTGWAEGNPIAHVLVPKIQRWGVDGLSAIMIHGRSRLQRYQKLADWNYIQRVASSQSSDLPRIPIIGNGDIFSYEDYEEKLSLCPDASPTAMLARGALIKPWLPTEIKERRHWDISSSERLDMLKEFVRYGLEHWGSDQQGVNATRRFLLEWLSFLYRYVPVGMLERAAEPQRMNQRPPNHMCGRNDLETLMLSKNCADWIKISEMLLGPVPDGFRFEPKHKANAYS